MTCTIISCLICGVVWTKSCWWRRLIWHVLHYAMLMAYYDLYFIMSYLWRTVAYSMPCNARGILRRGTVSCLVRCILWRVLCHAILVAYLGVVLCHVLSVAYGDVWSKTLIYILFWCKFRAISTVLACKFCLLCTFNMFANQLVPSRGHCARTYQILTKALMVIILIIGC